MKIKVVRKVRRSGAPARPAPVAVEDALPFRGFSMAEARQKADLDEESRTKKTPQEVFAEIQRGNTRFWMDNSQRPAERNPFQRRALLFKQWPSTAILSCADSRVPVEIIFDQGLGEIFTVRVAGNCMDVASQASLQYAVKYLGVKVLIVMGHEYCGAIKAAQLPDEAIVKEPASLGNLLKGLQQGLDMRALGAVTDARALDREAVTANVKAQVDKLAEDPVIMDKVKKKELLLVGGFYELSSGIVDFFGEVSE